MSTTHHRYEDVEGHRLFYREAGSAGAPTVLLLHGFPASSFMFRNLIPRLAEQYHVIAPDHLGFGFSDAPSVADFAYTFDELARLTAGLLEARGIGSYAMYVQDYGAPIGWRLALANPSAVTAVITQNGNGYEVGFVDDFWKPIRSYWEDRSPETEAQLKSALTLDSIRWQYVTGVSDESLVSPDTWHHDFAQVSRPGNDLVQLRLFADYGSNIDLYPRLHAFLRESEVPLLALWGRNDEIFRPEGALAFASDSPAAEVCLLDGGHFLLESHLDAAAAHVLDFLGRNLP